MLPASAENSISSAEKSCILNVEDQTPIYIYGTVNIFCSSTAINELVQRYRDDAEEKTTEGEVASETGEEDLYPDVSE